MTDPRPVLVGVAETDSYLKWAAGTLAGLATVYRCELVLLEGPLSPSARQVAEALRGTPWEGSAPLVRTGLRELRRRLRSVEPAAVLLACTGPTVELVSVMLGRRRPVVASGLPGIALPVTDRALLYRRATDVLVAHSLAERERYLARRDELGLSFRVALTHLPYAVQSAQRPTRRGDRVVFAAQPTVPANKRERVQLLRALVAAAGPATPVVKLRATRGEALTHHEPFPYERLASENGLTDRLDFCYGSVADVLPVARCLVTVSSSAAVEAIAAGVPVLIADDWGVDEKLLNAAFRGSGLIGSITARGLDGATHPDPTWMHRNYFHRVELDDLTMHLGEAIAERRLVRAHRPVRTANLGRVARAVVRRTGWRLV